MWLENTLVVLDIYGLFLQSFQFSIQNVKTLLSYFGLKVLFCMSSELDFNTVNFQLVKIKTHLLI